MNEKQFNIFKNWRLKKYNIDLSKLQNDLANRGMAMSSEREREEKWLKEECHSEIEMKKFESKEYEKEKKEQERERRNFIITNIILASVALLSLVLQILDKFKK